MKELKSPSLMGEWQLLMQMARHLVSIGLKHDVENYLVVPKEKTKGALFIKPLNWDQTRHVMFSHVADAAASVADFVAWAVIGLKSAKDRPQVIDELYFEYEGEAVPLGVLLDLIEREGI